MKLTVSTSAARSALFVSVAARVFLGLAIELPTTHNGAWLSALIGAMLAAPWVICVRGNGASVPVLLALAVVDAATVLASVTRSAGYLALDRTSPLLLALLAVAAALWCVWRNGNAVGYAASVWARLSLILILIVALLQGRAFRPAWLTPVLGDGWPLIVEGGVRAAGWIVTSSVILAVMESGDEPANPLPPLLGGALAAAGLLILAGMITPATTGGGWLNRLDNLLCNGRAPLYTQLPMIVSWFAGLLHLMSCQCFAAAALLQRLSGLGGKLCGTIVVAGVLLLSRLPISQTLSLSIARWGFVAAGLATALSSFVKKGGRQKCASGV